MWLELTYGNYGLIINRIDINCGNCVIYGCGQKNKFILKIYISNRKENMVRVNDNVINWPSLKVYNQMIKKLNTISMEEVDNNFKKRNNNINYNERGNWVL